MKIAVCTPCYKDPSLRFVVSRDGLFFHTLEVRPDIELRPLWTQGLIVQQARNVLLGDAFNCGADYALFVDADMIFPPDALLRLLAHQLEIVGVNAAVRFEPTGPTAANVGDDGKLFPVWTTRELAARGEVQRVDRIGFGLVLIDLSVIDKARKQSAASGGRLGPLFHFNLSDDGRELTTEDYYFCEQMEKFGVSVHIDHALSWATGHIHDRVLYPADTEIARVLSKAKKLKAASPP